MNDDPFSIENLKIEAPSADCTAAGAGKVTKAAKSRFVRLPGEWAHRLCRAKHLSTYKVAIYLLHLNWKSRGRPVRLANITLAQMGVGRDAKWRALLELESLGLVEVSRHERKSPVVILKNL